MKDLKPLDWILICGVSFTSLACLFVESITLNSLALKSIEEISPMDWVGLIAGVSGVCCVVLVAKRKIINYLFGIVNVSLYAYISYRSQIWGDAFLNACYYFPMQFLGWWQWSRNRESSGREDTVKAKRMSLAGRLWLFAGCAVSVLATGLVLKYFTSDPQPFKDAATTVLSIIAQFLMVRIFMEQWFLWITTNVLSVVMWSILWVNGSSEALLMVVMWLFYLANSINGLLVWNRASKR